MTAVAGEEDHNLWADFSPRRNPKGWFQKGGFGGCSPGTKTGTRVRSCSPGTKNRSEGTFGCSPGTETGTRAHSPKPPFYETALLSPGELCVMDQSFRCETWQFRRQLQSARAGAWVWMGCDIGRLQRRTHKTPRHRSSTKLRAPNIAITNLCQVFF